MSIDDSASGGEASIWAALMSEERQGDIVACQRMIRQLMDISGNPKKINFKQIIPQPDFVEIVHCEGLLEDAVMADSGWGIILSPLISFKCVPDTTEKILLERVERAYVPLHDVYDMWAVVGPPGFFDDDY